MLNDLKLFTLFISDDVTVVVYHLPQILGNFLVNDFLVRLT